MRLVRFRVTNFRSVDDSGWVDTDHVTALIGTNESGKTNLLLPLWKLRPAKDGAIEPVPDYPRARFTEIREAAEKPVFIRAVFELGDELRADVAKLAGVAEAQVAEVEISRTFDGRYGVSFPHTAPVRGVPHARVMGALTQAESEITRLTPSKTEETLKAAMLTAISVARDEVDVIGGTVDWTPLTHAHTGLRAVELDKATKRSAIVPHFTALLEDIAAMVAELAVPAPEANTDVRTLVLEQMPTFVYYSNYGNLDSEIYLPHVIENLKREGLGAKETAKARTLKVLFDFVGLSPQEVLTLGRDLRPNGREHTPDEVQAITGQKKERSVLLQSASTKLTREFRDWWKQGEYRFRFEADGDYFRIWVSDDRRPEDIELEARSTGLQWFLSFYLIFLVERADEHEDAILLLDEPGLSLHPLAQRDLSVFFDNLAKTNSILYTTHSPFLVGADRLDRVKAVYVNETGATVVSSDLRASEAKVAQTRSLYPVTAALGLTVSETMLLGCQVVVVEGPADQLYLSTMKTLLIASGRITPRRELVFVPAGGVRGVGAVVAITTGVTEKLPYVLVDSDGPGIKLATQLRTGPYQGAEERVLLVGAFAAELPGAEVEDLLPLEVVADEVRRIVRGPDDEFRDVAKPGQAIIPQIEAYASRVDVALPKGWKVELAKRVMARLLRQGSSTVPDPVLERWGQLFDQLLAAPAGDA